MTYTTAEKLSNFNEAGRQAYRELAQAEASISFMLRTEADVDVEAFTGGVRDAAQMEAVLDAIEDIRTDLAILSGMQRRIARLVRMTNQHNLNKD